jgi:cytoskeletal protein CcmA (bactofilin family)
MFRTDRNSSHKQATGETPHTTTPPPQQAQWPGNASSHDAIAGATYQSSPQSANGSRAVTESEALARDIKEGILTGFVGNGTVLTGEANFKGMLRIDGRLTGSINSQDGTLIVGAGGQVDASIEVAVATIHGTINGDIIASKRIEIGRTSRVIGNIQTPTLIIEQGAVFEGSCRMIQLQEAAGRRAPGETHEKASSLLAESEAEDMEDVSSVAS